MSHAIEQLAYLAATVLFIFSLYWMNAPKTARRAVQAGVAGMTLAVLATWFQPQIVHRLESGFGMTGVINAIPYVFAAVAMVLWGRHSDRTGERPFHVAAAYALGGVGLIATALMTDPFALTLTSLPLPGSAVPSQVFLVTGLSPSPSGTSGVGANAFVTAIPVPTTPATGAPPPPSAGAFA